MCHLRYLCYNFVVLLIFYPRGLNYIDGVLTNSR